LRREFVQDVVFPKPPQVVEQVSVLTIDIFGAC
jgi:hypothetical protein